MPRFEVVFVAQVGFGRQTRTGSRLAQPRSTGLHLGPRGCGTFHCRQAQAPFTTRTRGSTPA